MKINMVIPLIWSSICKNKHTHIYIYRDFQHLPSRELTYPTLGKGKSSSKVPFFGDMLVSRRVLPSWGVSLHFRTPTSILTLPPELLGPTNNRPPRSKAIAEVLGNLATKKSPPTGWLLMNLCDRQFCLKNRMQLWYLLYIFIYTYTLPKNE